MFRKKKTTKKSKIKSEKRKGKSQIQAIIFPKNSFPIYRALAWLRIHNYKPIKPVDITKNYYRFRINPPISGANFRMIRFGGGIKAIIQF